MTINVSIASDSDGMRWSAFLARANPDHHAWNWQWREIISNVFGHHPYYLIAEDQAGAVGGVLPLFYVRSIFFGRALVSVPYLSGGGCIALSDDARHALLQRAAELATEHSVRYLEFRCREAEDSYSEKFLVRTHKVSMKLALAEDPESLFQSLPAKLRSQVRRPTKSGLYAEVVTGLDVDQSSLRSFYTVFSRNMRDLGTPVYPISLFQETIRGFGNQARIITVRHKSKAVASGITLCANGVTEISWASSLQTANRYSPNMLLYWEAIKAACLGDDDNHTFDFGRSSPGTGAYNFKQQWGAKSHTLYWYYLKSLGTIPDVNPRSKKFTLLTACWRRLPTPLTNIIGPGITRGLP